MKTVQPLLAPIILWSMLTGCSASLPLSEAYIFNKDEILSERLYPRNDSLTWRSSKGGVVSFNNNAAAIEDHLADHYAGASFTNTNKIALGFSSASNAESFSFGYNIGYNVLGMNATLGVGWNTYLTLNASMLGGELILQRPVFRSSTDASHGGVTLGAFAKREYYAYRREPDSMWDVFMDIHGLRDLAPIDVYGVRSMVHWRLFYDVMTHGFLSYGYAPQLKGPLVNVGFVLGFDNFK